MTSLRCGAEIYTATPFFATPFLKRNDHLICQDRLMTNARKTEATTSLTFLFRALQQALASRQSRAAAAGESPRTATTLSSLHAIVETSKDEMNLSRDLAGGSHAYLP
jgi:hypothetical protein